MYSKLHRKQNLKRLAGLLLVLSLLLAACGDKTATTVAATATSSATVVATPSGEKNMTGKETEVSFKSGADTLYGSLLLPPNSDGKKLPATLLIAGSGPTDRNGNSALMPGGATNTLLNFANLLAEQNIVTLRYDKLGTGKTSLGQHDPTKIGLDIFKDEAVAAYEFLASQPTVDPQHIMIVGHSEGGLLALMVADQYKNTANAPKTLVLASPLSVSYIETLQRQLHTQMSLGLQMGQITKEQADTANADIDAIVKSLSETGKYPATVTSPIAKQFFSPANETFFASTVKYDPRKIAAQLPKTVNVMISLGTKDGLILPEEAQQLKQAFVQTGNSNVQLVMITNANHVYKETPGEISAADYGNPNIKFSAEMATKLSAYVKANL